MATIWQLSSDPDDFSFFNFSKDGVSATFYTTMCSTAPLAGSWSPPRVTLEAAAKPTSDFPSLTPEVLVLSERAVAVLKSFLEPTAELLPLPTPLGVHFIVHFVKSIDALAVEQSEVRRRPFDGRILEIRKWVLLPEKVAGLDLFRIPETLRPLASDSFVEAASEHDLVGMIKVPVWRDRSTPGRQTKPRRVAAKKRPSPKRKEPRKRDKR